MIEKLILLGEIIMDYIDMHVHSTASDGTYTPTEVAALAQAAGLRAFALTDHDTVNGIKEVMSIDTPLEIIPGIELSAGYGNGDIHILGYYISPDCSTLTEATDFMVNERIWRNKKMADNLAAAGIDISVEQLYADNPDAVLTRAHFANHLLKHGYVKDKAEAFKKYLGEDTPYYVLRQYLSPEECIDIIREAGGYAVLAHPFQYKLPADELNALIKRLKDAGLFGLEALYSTYTKQEEDIALSLAHRYSLAVTGGSDFHGSNKPDIQIGKGLGNLAVPYEFLEQFKLPPQ